MNICTMWTILGLTILLAVAGSAHQCVPRSFGADRIVCVCNATYCDGLPTNQPDVPADGSAYWYVSSKEGQRLDRSRVVFSNTHRQNHCNVTLTINTAHKYQTILGFGGAFTDAAGINIKKLSRDAQKRLIRAYYDPKAGSKYTLGRIPIGGTDFSTRPYTYDDVANDTTLKHFSLAREDCNFKIPYAKMALQLNSKVKFFAGAWSAPAWMKTNNRFTGYGFLKNEYYQLYTDYLLKFMKEYHKHGLTISAITTGNEPFNANIPSVQINSMGWTPSTMATWVANYLGPTLASSEFRHSDIMAFDDQRIYLPWYMDQVFENEKGKRYIKGIAVHWYTDIFSSATILDQTHDKFPNKYLLMTEACTGTSPLEKKKVRLGSWDRAEKYALSIIEYLNHWAVGWVDWNLALDKQGGPSYIKNFVDSPIIVNPETDEFFKQPMYYALKHFSRFIDSGSRRISITDNDSIKSTAFLTPSQEVVVVLYNGENSTQCVTLKDRKKTGNIFLKLPPYSINTLKYRN